MIQEIYRCIICLIEFPTPKELAEHKCGRAK